MPRQTELVMYTRTSGCPFVSLARSVLQKENVVYREVYINRTRKPASACWIGWAFFRADLDRHCPSKRPPGRGPGAPRQGPQPVASIAA